MRTQGFTVIDLMIVMDIMALIVVMAVPNPLPTQSVSNESNAITTLRNLVRQQAQFQKMAYMDEDQDGRGEYGSFGELSGLSNLIRNGVGTPSPLSPPLFPITFTMTWGYATSSRYLFVLFLPDAASNGICDLLGGGPNPAVDPDKCEAMWCAYAWPVIAGVTGKRAFFVNQAGVVLQTDMSSVQYNGAAFGPTFAAALSYWSMAAPVALPPLVGVDTNTWTPVN